MGSAQINGGAPNVPNLTDQSPFARLGLPADNVKARKIDSRCLKRGKIGGDFPFRVDREKQPDGSLFRDCLDDFCFEDKRRPDCEVFQ